MILLDPRHVIFVQGGQPQRVDIIFDIRDLDLRHMSLRAHFAIAKHPERKQHRTGPKGAVPVSPLETGDCHVAANAPLAIMVRRCCANCFTWRLVPSAHTKSSSVSISFVKWPKASLRNSCSTTFKTKSSRSPVPSSARKKPTFQPISLSIRSSFKIP